MTVPVQAIKYLGERLQLRLQDTQKYHDELKEFEEGAKGYALASNA